jgi:hypothetical protein
MIQFHTDFWGPKVELDHSATQTLLDAGDVALALNPMIAVVSGTIAPPLIPVIAIMATGIAAYISANRSIVATVDKGNGVWLTIPWPAIWWGQWWIIVPTTR